MDVNNTKVRLVAKGGELVAEFEIGPFSSLHDIILWGSRVFAEDKSYDLPFPVYRECFAYHIPSAQVRMKMEDA